MKQLRIFFLIAYFIMGSSLLFFCFSGISIAEQTHKQACISSCDEKKLVCFNINADKRICEVKFESCIEACKSEKKSPSTPQQDSEKAMKPM